MNYLSKHYDFLDIDNFTSLPDTAAKKIIEGLVVDQLLNDLFIRPLEHTRLNTLVWNAFTKLGTTPDEAARQGLNHYSYIALPYVPEDVPFERSVDLFVEKIRNGCRLQARLAQPIRDAKKAYKDYGHAGHAYIGVVGAMIGSAIIHGIWHAIPLTWLSAPPLIGAAAAVTTSISSKRTAQDAMAQLRAHAATETCEEWAHAAMAQDTWRISVEDRLYEQDGRLPAQKENPRFIDDLDDTSPALISRFVSKCTAPQLRPSNRGFIFTITSDDFELANTRLRILVAYTGVPGSPHSGAPPKKGPKKTFREIPRLAWMPG